MKQIERNMIMELYEEIDNDRNFLIEIVKKNEIRIIEIDTFLKSLYGREDSGYKVFSPRNVDTVCAEEIEKNNLEKQKYEKENIEYNKRIASLSSYLSQIMKICEC